MKGRDLKAKEALVVHQVRATPCRGIFLETEASFPEHGVRVHLLLDPWVGSKGLCEEYQGSL